jgi:predicted nucleic acid-binding protein
VIVLDASVLLAAEDADDPQHRDAERLLQAGHALATIDLAAYEVTNVAETRWHDPAAGGRLRERVWLIATLGRLVRVDRALADDAGRLAREHRLSAYDAAYLAAAHHLRAPLASCDRRDLVDPGLAVSPGHLVS